jgi:hypothetical protein
MESYTGEVYDIDYISGNGWCQILLRNGPDSSIAVVTDNHQIQTILETAMAMKLPAEVFYTEKEPHWISRAKVNNG